MSLEKVVSKAIHCERNDRIIQAHDYFEKAMKMVVETKHSSELARIYFEHFTILKHKLECRLIDVALKKIMYVPAYSLDHKAEKLFGEYLANVKELIIFEPILTKLCHQKNILRFLCALHMESPKCKYIRFVTVKTSSPHRVELKLLLAGLKNYAKRADIKLAIKFVDVKPEPKIVLSNGYILTTKCGLHLTKTESNEVKIYQYRGFIPHHLQLKKVEEQKPLKFYSL